jgi:hypothetical protein
MENKSIQNQNYNLTEDEYNHLYKKYVNHRSPSSMLSMNGVLDLDGKIIWDICCGANMRATKEFLSKGAKFVVSIDNYRFEPTLSNVEKMTELKSTFLNDNFHLVDFRGIDTFIKSFNSLLARNVKVVKPNLIFCQQGMSYIFSPTLILNLVECLECPTNNHPYGPSNIIFNIPKFSIDKMDQMRNGTLTKKYEIDGEQYLENNWIDGSVCFPDFGAVNILHHIQWCKSLGSHYTKFYYLNHHRIISFLKENKINHEVIEDENTIFFKI